jgi:hypothetical protein
MGTVIKNLTIINLTTTANATITDENEDSKKNGWKILCTVVVKYAKIPY